jgi:glycosyltransferase involved in cell wall biosynthesis
MTRVVVIDASVSGHHETYMANIAEGLIRLGRDVVLVTAEKHQNSPAAKRLASISSSIKVLFAPLSSDSAHEGGLKADILRERAYWQFSKMAYNAAACEGSVDHVVLPYADHCIHAIATCGLPFGRAPVTAITMRPVFHHQNEGVDTPANRYLQRMKQKLFESFLSKPTVQRVLTIDPTLANFAQKRASLRSCWEKVSYLPDPVAPPIHGDKHASRVALGLSGQAPLVLIYGAIDTRKGVEPLLRALASLPATGSPSVILAGEMSSSIRLFVATAECQLLIDQGRLTLFERYVSEEEERHLLLASDAVWLGYVGHFAMSGVLVKAAQYGRPVIATKRGLLGWFARDLPGAQVIDVEQPAQIRAALSSVSQVGGEVSASLQQHNWQYAMEKLS